MKNEKRFVKYDKELHIEAYWFQGILQKFPQHFHEYYVIGFVEKSGLRHMCYDNVDYYITAGDVLLFNYCVPHNCEPMDNDLLDLRCLNIKPEIMSQFMQELTGSEEVPLFASPVLRGDELSGSLLRELHQMIMQEREDLAKEETFYFLLEQLVAAGISKTSIEAESPACTQSNRTSAGALYRKSDAGRTGSCGLYEQIFPAAAVYENGRYHALSLPGNNKDRQS